MFFLFVCAPPAAWAPLTTNCRALPLAMWAVGATGTLQGAQGAGSSGPQAKSSSRAAGAVLRVENGRRVGHASSTLSTSQTTSWAALKRPPPLSRPLSRPLTRPLTHPSTRPLTRPLTRLTTCSTPPTYWPHAPGSTFARSEAVEVHRLVGQRKRARRATGAPRGITSA